MSNNLNPPESTSLPYYVAKYKGRTVAIKRDPDYQATIKLLQKSIAKLRAVESQDIIISTSLAHYGDAVIEISEEIWPDVVGSVQIVEVNFDEPEDPVNNSFGPTETRSLTFTPSNASAIVSGAITAALSHPIPSPASTQTLYRPLNSSINPGDHISITIRTTSQTLVTLGNLHASSTIQEVKRLVEKEHGIPATLQRLELSGTQLGDGVALGQLNILGGAPVDLILNTRRSTIYLLPAYRTTSRNNGYGSYSTSYHLSPLDKITVHMSVNRKWEMTAFQPCDSDLLADCIQSTSWTINVPDEQTLSDPNSGSKMPWLYWDGSPSIRSSSLDTAAFQEQSVQLSQTTELYQAMQVLEANNSVAVPFGDVEKYLSGVLPQPMGSRGHILRPLLSHLKSNPCSHIAVRFLPQDEYRKTAALSILDVPDAQVNYVALIYKRLDDRTASLWDSVPPFRDGQAPAWRDVINPGSIIEAQNRSQILIVDFSFLEVP